MRVWKEEGLDELVGKEEELVGWECLTFALWLDRTVTKIVEVEDEPMLAPSMWDFLMLEVVEGDGCKWVEVGLKEVIKEVD